MPQEAVTRKRLESPEALLATLGRAKIRGHTLRAGVQRIVLNGSFVTDIMEPNDVDCALLLAADYPRDTAASDELIKGLPFLEVLRVDEHGFDRLVHRFFATDRHGAPKGMIEILL